MNRRNRWLACLFLFMFPKIALADDFKFDGWVGSSFKVDAFKNGETEHDVKLEFKTKRKKGVRAEVSLRGDSDENAVVIEDAYIDKELDEQRQLEFGRAKLRLGLEYEMGDEDRLAIRRSPIYRKLEAFAYVGRQLVFRYKKESDQESGAAGYSLSLGYGESLDTSLVFHWEKPTSFLNYGAWVLLQADRVEHGNQFAWATVFSLWTGEPGPHFTQVELLTGKDPFESDFENILGTGKDIHFAALKTEWAYRIATGEDTAWVPVLQASVIAHDTSLPRYNSLVFLMGVNYWYDDLRLAFNMEVVGVNSRIDLTERSYDDSSLMVEAKYYF